MTSTELLLEIVVLAAIGAGIASQLISTLLSQLTSSSPTSSVSAATGTTTASTVSAFQPAMPQPGGTCANSGPPKSSLSGDVLMALMSLQAQPGASTQAGASNPVQNLFSAMDSDGDGSVSKSEMESYMQKQGGTKARADSLFSSLSLAGASSGSSASATGVSESQMQSAVSTAQLAHGHHHKAGGSDQVANTLMQAIDSNADGAVSQGELTRFVTANGGKAAEATSDFSALKPSGSSSLNSADFSKAWNAYQAQQNSQSAGSTMISMLDALSKAARGSSVSVNA